MTVVVLCSASGSPGVTTAALAVGASWGAATGGRRAVVVDADPAGSALLPVFAQAGLPVPGGVLNLATARSRLDLAGLLAQCVALDGEPDRWVLAGIGDPIQARVLGPVWRGLLDVAGDLHAEGVDLVVDAGRLGHEHQPAAFLDGGDVVAVVLRAELTSVALTAPVLARVVDRRGPARPTTALLVGPGRPYSAKEVARELDLPDLAVLDHDPRAASDLMSGRPRQRAERTRLLTSARFAAARLAGAPADLVQGAHR